MNALYLLSNKSEKPHLGNHSNAISNQAGDTYYLMKDRLGSIINILDENETLKTTYSYDAFGDPTATYHSGQVDCMYRFTGRVFDDAMGNYFYRARYYNQSLGRFFSRDPIISLQTLYAYCNNSPANFTDPSGTFSVPDPNPAGGGGDTGGGDASSGSTSDWSWTFHLPRASAGDPPAWQSSIDYDSDGDSGDGFDWLMFMELMDVYGFW